AEPPDALEPPVRARGERRRGARAPRLASARSARTGRWRPSGPARPSAGADGGRRRLERGRHETLADLRQEPQELSLLVGREAADQLPQQPAEALPDGAEGIASGRAQADQDRPA